MITSETRAEKIKRKQKTKINIERKKSRKQDVNGKTDFSSSRSNSKNDYVDESTNSMFDGNKILKSEENFQYNFCNTIVEKDEKNIKIKGEKKKTSSFQTSKNNLEKKKLKLVNVRGDENCIFRSTVS